MLRPRDPHTANPHTASPRAPGRPGRLGRPGSPPVRWLFREILVRVMVVCGRLLQLFGASGGAVAAFALIVLAVAGLLIAAPDGRSSAQP